MIEKYVGYNRMLEPYRTCMICREKVRKFDREKTEKDPEYWKGFYRERYETKKDKLRESRNKLIKCPHCSTEIKNYYLPKHKRTIMRMEAQAKQQEK